MLQSWSSRASCLADRTRESSADGAPLVLSRFVSHRLVWFVAKERASDLERLTDLIASGQVTPSIDRTYPLDQVPDAMRHLVSGQVRGKAAITI